MDRFRGGGVSQYGFILLYRSGKLCARYVRADLPLLNLQSRAGLNSVLGLGIALAVIGAVALVAVAVIAMRVRRRSRYKRAPVTAAPGCAARMYRHEGSRFPSYSASLASELCG